MMSDCLKVSAYGIGYTGVWLCLLSLFGCFSPQPTSPVGRAWAEDQQSSEVLALAYPLQFIAQRLAGSTLEVHLILPTGESASHWAPGRDEILRCQQAALVVANGRGARLAGWLDHVSIPESRICESARRGLSLEDFIFIDDAPKVHSHGTQGQHSHASSVAFTWLDPAMSARQAVYIAARLREEFPELETTVQENLKQLEGDLEEMSGIVSGLEEKVAVKVCSANSNFMFLTRASGLSDKRLDWLDFPDLEQAARDLEESFGESERDNGGPDERGAVLILPLNWKNHTSCQRLLEILETRSVRPIWIDTMDRQPETGDYIEVMRQNLQNLNDGLSPPQ